MLRTILPRLHRFAAARVAPDGVFGLHLTAGVLVLLAAAFVFARIAEGVVTGAAITVLDAQLAQWFHAHATPALTRVMLFVTHWHSVAGILAMVVLLAAWLWQRRERYWVLALVAAVPGGQLLNVLMKTAFQRPRPQFDDPFLTLPTYSFPSGHTVAATLLYGFLACYVFRHVRDWRWRCAALVLACLLVALVALSRMYLGVHYLSDVLAAVCEGCAWLAICLAATTSLQRRNAARSAGRGA
ncbi:phosphatase PAP2 family protein [Massilia horti]|uniref:Phosphatase PAP2 family protein n=1 Tax=Massilia horti TaxID=2562153 RepID=A0A4Y9T3M8_9BURK|nr:phosphatase PAP2 family protein [Massilia horti]TFW31654.1 phosphatase PAP2 family protein [Massilia horti]